MEVNAALNTIVLTLFSEQMMLSVLCIYIYTSHIKWDDFFSAETVKYFRIFLADFDRLADRIK